MDHATLDEIHDQPSALDAMLTALHELESELDAVATPSTNFCLVGCGTSYYLSQVGSTLLDQVASAEAIPGGEVLLSPDAAPDDVDVIVPVSRSGESTETVRATDALRERHPEATVLGVTCTAGSPIDERADTSVVSPDGAEESVVMTKSFSSMVLAFEYLAALVEGAERPAERLQSVADDSATAVDRAEEVVKPLASDTDYETFFFLGTGEYFGLASEGMLKLEEMTLSWTKAYHPMEFRHGPQSIADDETLVTLFLPERGYDLHADLVGDARELGATVLVVGSAAAVDAVEADHSVVLPDRDTGRLPLYAPAFQLLGYYRAVALGLNPDDPQNLSQVVTL
jgi:glucosamine--fructose-6-phosphate aminotransferase (isomerizing)